MLVASAMQFTSLIQMTLIAMALIGANAYLRRSPATAQDLRIARQAMPISEVKLMLHGGSSQDSITDEVKRRHIPEKISAATELELTESGAKPALIAALKDENNILTENQKDAFDERAALRAERTQLTGLPSRPMATVTAAAAKPQQATPAPQIVGALNSQASTDKDWKAATAAMDARSQKMQDLNSRHWRPGLKDAGGHHISQRAFQQSVNQEIERLR